MLQPVKLTLPQAIDFTPETQVLPELPADATQFAATLAEELRPPIEVNLLQQSPSPGLPQDTGGTSLPQTGNPLPELTVQTGSGPAQSDPDNSLLWHRTIQAAPFEPVLAKDLSPLAGNVTLQPVLPSSQVTIAAQQTELPGPVHAQNLVAEPAAPILPSADLARQDPVPGPAIQSLPDSRSRADLTRTKTAVGQRIVSVVNETTETQGFLRPEAAADEVLLPVGRATDMGSHDRPRSEPDLQNLSRAKMFIDAAGGSKFASPTGMVAPPSATSAAPSPAAPTTVESVGVPVRDAAWGEAISDRVVLMAGRNAQTAEIRLVPADLGPLRVQLAFSDGATDVTFSAQHAVTRDAIEGALPRLREIFLENDLLLGNATVTDHGTKQDQRQPGDLRDNQSGIDAERLEGVDSEDAGDQRRITTSRGLVDTFA